MSHIPDNYDMSSISLLGVQEQMGSNNIYTKIIASFILGALVMYVYAEFKRTSDIKSIVKGHMSSYIHEASQKIYLVNLVKQNNINEYYRISCLSINGDYKAIKDKPFEFEYNEREKKAIEELEFFINEYKEKGLCSFSQ